MLITAKFIYLVVSSIAQDKVLPTLESRVEISASAVMTNPLIHPRLPRLSAIVPVLRTPPNFVAVLGG